MKVLLFVSKLRLKLKGFKGKLKLKLNNIHYAGKICTGVEIVSRYLDFCLLLSFEICVYSGTLFRLIHACASIPRRCV